MTSHIIHFPYMSETIVTIKEDMDTIKKYEQEDRDKGIRYCIVRDNLSPRENSFHKYNYYCYLTNKQFYHIRYGYLPWPKKVPFSEDIGYMKSVLNLWLDRCYGDQQKIIKMNLQEFYTMLSKIPMMDDDNISTRMAKKEYLEMFKKKWNNHEGLSLVEVGKKDDFIYRGLVLFNYLPEFFVKIYM
jgi:hypothetical protein